jgi:hypothetical protein
VRIAAIPILSWLFRQHFEPPRPWPVATPSSVSKEGNLSTEFRDRDQFGHRTCAGAPAPPGVQIFFEIVDSRSPSPEQRLTSTPPAEQREPSNKVNAIASVATSPLELL